MPLPKLDLPRHKHYLHGLGKNIKYRGFTVKEQKILLHAKEEETEDAMIEAIHQIIELCTNHEVDPEQLPFFDIEDLFLRIRAKSVGEVIELKYRVRDADGKPTKDTMDIQLNLDEVEVTFPEGHDKKIMITDDIGIMMKYPTLTELSKYRKDDMALLEHCIECIFTEEEVHYLKDVSREEIDEFMDSLDVVALNKVKSFFETMPRIRHSKEVTLPDGSKETLEFEGLQDFF